MEQRNRLQEGSVFFTENKFYKKMKNIPEEYEIPLFMKKRLKIHKEKEIAWGDYIRHGMEKYKKFHETCKKKRKLFGDQSVCDETESKCNKRKISKDIFETKLRPWDLPPNRYTIKGNDMADIIHKQTGIKGPYACFSVPRTDATWPGHFAPRKFKGSQTLFYNVPSEMERFRHPRKYFVMKIRKMPTNPQRPYLRCMISDITLCWHNPDEPGPDAYYPTTHCIGAGVVRQGGIKPPKPMFFYPSTTVPILENSYVRNNYNPGPERYRPDMIACPCKPGYSYDENVLYELARLKRKRFGRKKYLRLLNKCKLCNSGKMRNIPGNGHGSVFNSKTFRLVKKMDPFKATEKEIKVTNSPEYFRMVQRPRRSIFTINLNYLIINRDRKYIFFNTTQRKRRRCKLKVNKRVAFASSVPRFINASEINEVFLAARPKDVKPNKKVSKESKAVEEEVKKRYFTMKTVQRLTKLPQRYVADLNTRQPKEAVFNFLPLPQPNYAGDADDMTNFSYDQLPTISKPLNINDFIQNRFIYGNDYDATDDFTNDLPPSNSETMHQEQSYQTLNQ